MPAKAAGVHGPRPSMLTWLGLTVEEVDLSDLSSKALTLLLQGRHEEEDAGFKVRRQSRRHVRAFLALSRADQHKVLMRNEVWVYREDWEREVDDNKVLQLLNEEEEEEELAEDERPTLEAATGLAARTRKKTKKRRRRRRRIGHRRDLWMRALSPRP